METGPLLGHNTTTLGPAEMIFESTLICPGLIKGFSDDAEHG